MARISRNPELAGRCPLQMQTGEACAFRVAGGESCVEGTAEKANVPRPSRPAKCFATLRQMVNLAVEGFQATRVEKGEGCRPSELVAVV